MRLDEPGRRRREGEKRAERRVGWGRGEGRVGEKT